MELTQAGQFEIESAELFTSTGNTINITNSVLEVNIYEDIYSNSMYGELMFGNTVGLINYKNLPHFKISISNKAATSLPM